MTQQVDKLYQEASRLPLAERAALAGLLVDTLEGAVDPEVEKAWREEVIRRIAELDAGEVTTIPWQQVRSKVRSIVGLSH
jgi:putative addiction module component (TIGR02574 family)